MGEFLFGMLGSVLVLVLLALGSVIAEGDQGRSLKMRWLDNGFTIAALNTLGFMLICCFVLCVLYEPSMMWKLIFGFSTLLSSAICFVFARKCERLSQRRMRAWRSKVPLPRNKTVADRNNRQRGRRRAERFRRHFLPVAGNG